MRSTINEAVLGQPIPPGHTNNLVLDVIDMDDMSKSVNGLGAQTFPFSPPSTLYTVFEIFAKAAAFTANTVVSAGYLVSKGGNVGYDPTGAAGGIGEQDGSFNGTTPANATPTVIINKTIIFPPVDQGLTAAALAGFLVFAASANTTGTLNSYTVSLSKISNAGVVTAIPSATVTVSPGLALSTSGQTLQSKFNVTFAAATLLSTDRLAVVITVNANGAAGNSAFVTVNPQINFQRFNPGGSDAVYIPSQVAIGLQ